MQESKACNSLWQLSVRNQRLFNQLRSSGGRARTGSKPVASVFKKGCQKVCYKLSLDELATLFWEVEGFWKDQKTYKEYHCLQRTSIKKKSLDVQCYTTEKYFFRSSSALYLEDVGVDVEKIGVHENEFYWYERFKSSAPFCNYCQRFIKIVREQRWFWWFFGPHPHPK